MLCVSKTWHSHGAGGSGASQGVDRVGTCVRSRWAPAGRVRQAARNISEMKKKEKYRSINLAMKK
jgi:hypothetical protein